MYWWLNTLQRQQALAAKKWYVRENPRTQGFTADDLKDMSVHQLSKQMTGYTQGISGSRASKSKLRRLILSMVQQIEIETRRYDSPVLRDASGDIPCLFGTLTSQRYGPLRRGRGRGEAACDDDAYAPPRLRLRG